MTKRSDKHVRLANDIAREIVRNVESEIERDLSLECAMLTVQSVFSAIEQGHPALQAEVARLNALNEKLARSLRCIQQRAERAKGKATGHRPFKSATESCAWIASEAQGALDLIPKPAPDGVAAATQAA